MALIFQYGSNCDAARLNAPERLAGGAVEHGRALTVDEFELTFDVWSQTNGCAASDLISVPGTGRHAWGVLYEIPNDRVRERRKDGLKTLAQIEGPRYAELSIRIRTLDEQEVEAITFVVRPIDRVRDLWTSAEYVRHIVNGLREHGVPEEYVLHVIATAIETNRNAMVAADGQTQLIAGLRNVNSLR